MGYFFLKYIKSLVFNNNARKEISGTTQGTALLNEVCELNVKGEHEDYEDEIVKD